MDELPAIRLHDALFSSAAMRDVFSDVARLQAMLDVEAALARAEARVGIVPAPAAAAIAAQCKAESYDLDALALEAVRAGNLAIPLIKALRAKVGADASDCVHRGATSQDVLDTALVLQLRAGLDLIEADAARLAESVATLADAQRRTVIAGRTWMQQALPVTLGLKAAGWLDAMTRHRERLHALRSDLLVVQLGGAAGTLAAFEGKGLRVALELARELRLRLPHVPWHAQRDRMAECASVLGLLVGSLGKVARDVSLLSQTEVGEMSEPAAPGRGGSSSMPQKRNPVACAVALAAAIRVPPLVATMLAAMVQEHERGLGGWQAEWGTLPEIFLLASGALAQLADALAAPQLDIARMSTNLGATHGLILAEAAVTRLTAVLGRDAARRIVDTASQRALGERRPLRDLLAESTEVRTHLSSADLDALFDPARYVGEADALIDRALAAHRALQLE